MIIADIFENKFANMNIFQPLTQESSLRQVEDVLAAIESECEEGGQ